MIRASPLVHGRPPMDLLDVLIFSAGEGGYAHGDLVHTVASTSTRAVMLPICAPKTAATVKSQNQCFFSARARHLP